MTTSTSTSTSTSTTSAQPQSDPVVTLTEAAGRHVQNILSQTPNAIGLRVGVKKSGCSGFGYVVDYAMTIHPSDVDYLSQGVKVVIDANHLPYLKGMQIDCQTEGLNQVLKFINPNATGACGCGESFSVNE